MALVTDFQSCCTASILYGFGQEAAADGQARREGNGKTYEQTRNSIIQRVKQKQGERDGLMTAITTNNQTIAIKVLTELGFQNSGEVEKLRHPDNTICLWWLPLKDWVEPVVVNEVAPVANPFAKQPEDGRIRIDLNVFAEDRNDPQGIRVGHGINDAAEQPRRLLGYHYKLGARTYIKQTRENGRVVIAHTVEDRKLYTNNQQAVKTNVLRQRMFLAPITVEAVYAN